MSEMQWVIDAYFSDTDRRVELAPGEILFEGGAENNKLYYLVEGTMSGFEHDETGGRRNRLLLKEGDFVGVHSFFGKPHIAAYTLIANKHCKLNYIALGCPTVEDDQGRSFYEQCMPVLISDLRKRTHTTFGIAEAQAHLRDKQRKVERLMSLGDLSAGIAHELNNCFAVISKGAHYFKDTTGSLFEGLSKELYVYGLEKGRFVSSRELRKLQRSLVKECSLESSLARSLAATGMDLEKLFELAVLRESVLCEALQAWEMGATLNDMNLATKQSENVLTSMRLLGVAKSEKQKGVDLNDTIKTALALIRNKTKHLNVLTDFQATASVYANAGELAQIWINLIKNAAEALGDRRGDEWDIRVSSRDAGRGCEVSVCDSGPGIAPTLLSDIFKPSVTTKKAGLDFGLGLGLTIVSRLVVENGGDISVTSREGHTEFRIFFDSENPDQLDLLGESDV